jgi:hypothetical protein
MQATTRLVAGLTVLGAALVTAGLQSGGPATSRSAAGEIAPVVVTSPVAASLATVRVAPHPRVLRTPPAHRPKPSPHPATATRPASATKAAATRAGATSSRPAPRTVRRTTTLTFRQALMRAVARIPTYHSGAARWVVSRAYDFWGTADWYHDVLYVSPDVPRSKLYDVAVHEWSHELSVLAYDGDVHAATSAMNAWFGGSGLTGPERAADCMALLQGATWTHYTTCTNRVWRQGAQALVSGKRLPA